MLFGDLNNPASDIAKAVKTYATTEVRADLRLNTGVRYQGI
jgi:molybdopterin-containing oxidoreductase family iron-sulfur binding subunit